MGSQSKVKRGKYNKGNGYLRSFSFKIPGSTEIMTFALDQDLNFVDHYDVVAPTRIKPCTLPSGFISASPETPPAAPVLAPQETQASSNPCFTLDADMPICFDASDIFIDDMSSLDFDSEISFLY